MEFNKISKPLDLIGREILPFVLRVGVKHEDLLAVNKVVDDSNPSPFPSSQCLPTNLPKTARTGNEITSLRIDDESGLKLGVRLIVNEVTDLLCEDVSLIKSHSHRYDASMTHRSKRHLGFMLLPNVSWPDPETVHAFSSPPIRLIQSILTQVRFGKAV
jgi:hypothetical protein